MRTLKIFAPVAAIVLAACSSQAPNSDLRGDLRKALDRANLTDVSVVEDHDHSVVTLGGHVPTEGAKIQAEANARSLYPRTIVVSNQIAVIPAVGAVDAKKIDVDLDKAIENTFDAALVRAKLHDRVKYAVKNQVVTLTGDVHFKSSRAKAARLAADVPTVKQVVNEVQIKPQRASSLRPR